MELSLYCHIDTRTTIYYLLCALHYYFIILHDE